MRGTLFGLYIPDYLTVLRKSGLPGHLLPEQASRPVAPTSQPSAHTTTCADLTEISSPQRPILFRPGFLAHNPHSCTGSLFRQTQCLVSWILKFLMRGLAFPFCTAPCYICSQSWLPIFVTAALHPWDLWLFLLKIQFFKQLVYFLKILAKFHLLREASLNHYFYRSPLCPVTSIVVTTY